MGKLHAIFSLAYKMTKGRVAVGKIESCLAVFFWAALKSCVKELHGVKIGYTTRPATRWLLWILKSSYSGFCWYSGIYTK